MLMSRRCLTLLKPPRKLAVPSICTTGQYNSRHNFHQDSQNSDGAHSSRKRRHEKRGLLLGALTPAVALGITDFKGESDEKSPVNLAASRLV